MIWRGRKWVDVMVDYLAVSMGGSKVVLMVGLMVVYLVDSMV